MRYFIKTGIYLALLLLTGSVQAQNLHSRAKDLPCLEKTFQVFAHLAVDSLRQPNITFADIQAKLDIVNQYFEPICVSFQLCEMDTMLDYTYNFLDRNDNPEMRSLYHGDNRINIYFVGNMLTLKCGFANEGGVAFSDGAYIFFQKTCGGLALTHQFGHLFGLKHTFEGNGEENVDGTNCETAGDEICDTPADPYNPILADSIVYVSPDCEFIYTGLDANGQFYQPDVGNIMSFYNCDCGFTREQYLKMAATYLNASTKLW